MKDPEGLFKSPPGTGYIARQEFKRRLEKDAEAREAYQRHVLEEKERRQALRQVRTNGFSFMCAYSLVSVICVCGGFYFLFLLNFIYLFASVSDSSGYSRGDDRVLS